MRRVVLVSALTLASAAGASAQRPTLAPSWNQLSPATTPEQRYISEMAYDAAHGQIVLFGGWGYFSGDLNDTWLWNGSNWTKASPLNSPPVRAGSEMAYDAAHGQVVLFGGVQLVGGNPVRLGDTWLWDGTNWTQANPANNPPARASCAMVYDPALGKVVMFGGVVGSGSLAPDGNDTWEWDGTNWTQVTTANSPSARDLYGMAYDAALGEVVIFGGDSNGSTFNDVWAFDGTNWTQLSASNSPSARYGAAMDYDPTSGQIVMFGGYDGSAYLGDTWVLGGTPGNLSWTQLTPSPSPAPRLAVNTMVYDSQQAQSVLFGGYDFNSNSYYNDTWTWGAQQNFGSINVCPPGNSTPAPCSNVQTLTYNIPASTTIGTINVVTQGAAGLDFSPSSGSTCAGFSGAGSCNVNVNFAPIAPGMRLGAVELLDNSGNLLVSTPIYGNGQAPEIAFGLAAQTNLGTGLQQPQGVAVDAAGNVFISDYGLGEVLKVAPGGGQTPIPATLANPYGVAVDGAGNVFIADTTNSRVVKVPYLGNGTYGAQTTVGSVTIPYGVAVDGVGNVYIVDSEIEAVVKVTPSGVQSTVATLAPGSNPYDVAVDAAGNLFVSEVDLKQIMKVTPNGTQIPISVSSLTCPYGVAVDAGGNLYVSDPCTAQVLQVTPGGTQTTLSINGLTQPIAMAADGAGNLYFGSAVATPVVKVNRSQPSTLNFGTVNVGARSSDLAISVQNIGNQLLTGSVGTVSGNDFGIDGPNSTCSTFSLLPGASCVESFYAQPQTVGTISSSVTTSDNSLNGNPATQPIILSALSLGPAVSVSVTGSGAGSGSVQSNPTGINCNLIAGTPSGTCSTTFSTGLQMSFEEIPTNGSTFVGWGGACASAGTSQFCTITITAATNVTATFASSATTFPLSVTLVGSGGTVRSDVAGISCSVSNGTNSGTCSSNYAGGTPVTLTATGAAGSTFVGWSGACTSAGTSPTCNVVVNQATNAIADFVQQNFGTVNVCPTGQSTPAPCSQTIALTYTMPVTTTIGVIQAVTQGVTGLDFSVSNGSTCTGTIAAGNSCTVNATFAPLAAGLRSGQVRLFDNNGNLIVSTLVYGTGAAPVSAFSPSAQIPVNTGTSLSYPNGLLTDAASNLFITDGDNHQVLKVAPNGIVTTVASGLGLPQGMAEDGGGNLFIATNSSAVVKIPAGCTTSACQQLISNPFGFQSELGVALDPTGNLFVGDFLNGQVAEVPVNGGPQTIVYNPTGCGNAPGCSDPVDLTTDTAGNLFIADFGLQTVAEVPVGCATQSCVKSIGTGWNRPEDVAVDAAGDVFVADLGLQQIVEVPFGCTTAACQIVLVNGISTVALAVDAAGDVFFDNVTTNQVFEITRSLPPSLSFALTNVGSTSADSPQAVSLQNVGNQKLTGSVALSLGANFAENASSSCGAGFTLVPGASCAESFSFTPQSTGAFTGAAVFSDNTFNLSPLVVVQNVGLSGTGGLNGQAVATVVPNVVGMTQAAATAALTNAGLTLGAVSSGYSNSEPAGSVMGESPAAGTQVNPGAAVAVRLSIGQAPAAPANPLSFENNYFVTGGYATAGVTLRGTGVGGMATGTISIAKSASPGAQGVPDGADIVDGYLYWEALENTATPSASTGTFLGYSITGQQIGSDLPFTDGTLSGTLRVYRANVNAYFPVGANGVRFGSGNFTVSLPDSGGAGFPITEGASLVEIYRVLSPNFPLTAVVLYDGAAIPASASTQNVQGFYDAVGGSSGTGETTFLYYANNSWNGTPAALPLGQSNQYTAPLNAGNAYAAVILSTPVNNSDNDGILDAWKAGPPSGDFFVGQPGYYDVKTSSWVPLPGAKHGHKDLFVQFDYMCGSVLASGACDPTQENLYPSPDPSGNDPLVMVQNAFTQAGISLHLEVGNAVAEDICTDNLGTNPPQLCQFPAEPGVIGWKNSLEFSKLWPRNFASCAAGGDCTARFPYGQKDSYHYVLFGHSLAIPAWNSRYGSLTAISVVSGVTTISTTDRGNGINACPSRITIGGVLSNPSLNGVYNTSSCPDTMTMIVATPGVPNWSYNFASNTPPEPAIGIISGTVSSISGYSDLGGADSAVTLGLWATAPNQDMSKRANVIAGTLFHEIGHTLGLSHGGLYYDTPGSYVPTFDVNCKTNYQSSMNYLFQLDGVGPSAAIAYSKQALMTLNESSLSSVSALTDGSNNPATYPTSAWYVPYTAGSTTASPATRHCDGTPLNNDAAYRVDGSITSNPGWANGQNIAFDGVPYTSLRGYNDLANIDLRQVGATGGQFASLASVLSFGNTATPTNVAAGGNVTLGSGGTITLGSGGNITLGSGGNVTLGSGGTIAPGSSGSVTLNNGGTVNMSAGGTITLGSGGNITLGSGGNVTLGSGGTITLGSGGNVTLGSGGTVTLGSGGTIALGSGGTVTIPSTGGTYTLPSGGGTITLGSGGNVTLGSGGNVTLGSGGTITLGSGGNVTLGSGGNVTLGSGGTIALGSGGNITLGSGGNVTLGSGGTITLGSGGNVTLGSGGNVTLGSGGNVTLGSGGNVTLGSGGNVTLGSGGTVTLGSGGNITLGSGGNVTLGSGGNVILGSGGNITLGSGGTVVMGSGGTITLGSGGGMIDGVQEPAGTYAVNSGQNVTFGSSGGNVTLGSGGNVTLGSGGNVTLGSGGNITLGSGGTVTLGSGGNVTLGSGGTVTLGSGGNITLGSGGNITLGSGGNITLGSGGVTTDELNYDTANSFVRPPPSATYTQETNGITVNWMPPVFGVVQSYTVYVSVNGGTPGMVGQVTGTNGNPPPTTLTDNNTSYPAGATLTYTITTTLVPDTNGGQRQSVPSPPATLTLDQTIVINPAVPSSVVISGTPLQVTAYATSVVNGQPSANGLEVSFTAAGACSIGSQSTTNGISTAMVNLNNTGSCTITASQAGSISTQTGVASYNAAQPVSATFAIVAENSGTTPQIINFPQLPNIQYGKTFALNATDNSGITINYNITGPCSPAGLTTGIGKCTITASAPAGTVNNITYSAASVTQSFSVDPAVLTVTAGNLTSPYGTIPSLTADYTVTGFVNGDTASVLGATAPALSTTATTTSKPAIYPIAISAGSLSAANYTFFLVPGTLTIQAASQTITFTTPAPASAPYKGTFPVAATSTSQLPVTLTVDATSTSVCSLANGVVTMNSGAGTCTIDANQAGNASYSAAAQVQSSATATPTSQTITFTTAAPTSAPYKGTFPVAATSSSQLPVTLAVDATSTSVCSLANGVVTMNTGTGKCIIDANQAGNANYSAATQVQSSATATPARQTITFTTAAPTSAPYKGMFPVAAMSTSQLPVTLSVDAASVLVCTLSNGTVTMISGTGTCTIDANQAGNANYSAAAQMTTSATATKLAQTITFTTPAPAYALYKSTFPVAASSSSNLTVTLSVATGSTSVCSLSNGTVTMNSSTGTCTINANQAGNTNYSTAPQVTTSAIATASVPPSGTACNGIYSGTFSGSLTVTNGQNCVFVGGGATGSVVEKGGNLSLSGGATIGNGLTVTGGTFTIGPSTTIKGSVTIQSIPKSATTNQVCGTTITGNLVFQSNSTAVLIGNKTSSCAGNNVKGNLQVQSNPAATTIDGNTVGANLQVQSNTGATQIFNNTITSALQCQSNTSITGGGNKAASKSGQCAKF